MRLYTGGYLPFYLQRNSPGSGLGQKKTTLELILTAPTRLKTILAQLNIPAEEVHLIAINGEVIDDDDPLVEDKDDVRIFSSVNGG